MNNDFTYMDHGTIVILTAHTDAACAWADEHLPDDRARWGVNGSAIEWRCFPAISNGIMDDGLTIDRE